MANKKVRSWRIRIFALCWLTYTICYFGRVNLSITLSQLATFHGVDKVAVGLIGSCFFWSYAIGQLTSGFLAEKVNTRYFIFAGLFLSGLCNGLFGFATSLPLQIVIWTINGLAQSTLWCSIVKIFSFWYSRKQIRGLSIYISTSMLFGYISAWGGLGYVQRFLPFQWTFYIPSAILIVFSLIWLLLARETPEHAGFAYGDVESLATTPVEGGGAPMPTAKSPLLKLFLTPLMLFTVIVCFAQGIIKDGIGSWGPTLIEETQNVKLSGASFFVLLIPIMSFVGLLLARLLGIWFKHNNFKTVSFLLILGAAFMFGLLIFVGSGMWIALILLSLTAAMMYGANSIMLGAVPMEYARYGRAAFMSGFLDFASYLAAGVSILISGSIVEGGGWNGVFLFWGVIMAAGFVCAVLAIPIYRKKMLS